MSHIKERPERPWWGQVHRGLVVDSKAKHYRRMRGAVWLFLYLIIHANRADGTLRRKHNTVATDMGLPLSTVRRWIMTLRRHGYVSVTHTGRSQVIHIRRWKTSSVGKSGAHS